jgi:hypothetical protein
MKSTTTLPHRSSRNAAKDAQAQPMPSSLPSRRFSPSKKDKQGGKTSLTPSIHSITLAAVNAANAAAVAATNPCRKPPCPLAPTGDALALVQCTLPANVAAFPAANIMPTAALAATAKFARPEAVAADAGANIMPTSVLAPTSKFARPEAVAADVSIATEASYSTLGVTMVDDSKMGVPTVRALAITAYFSIAEAVAMDVTIATAAQYSVATAAVDLAAAVASPVAVPALAVASVGKEGVSD